MLLLSGAFSKDQTDKNNTIFIKTGISQAEINSPVKDQFNVKIINTLYEFDDGPVKLAPDKETISFKRFLFEINYESSHSTGDEKALTDIRISAFDALSQTAIWEITDISDQHKIRDEYFLVTTLNEGCCGASNSYRAYSEMNGRFLCAYSFASKMNLPIILRSSACDPAGFRLLAYHDNYWPARDNLKFSDPHGKLTLAGIFTYATPMQPLQKLAIFLDEKAFNDSSSDPDQISIYYGNSGWDFSERTQKANFEVGYWNKTATDPKLIYSDLTIKLTWGEEVISIPILHDQIEMNGIRAGSRYYKQVILLPPEYWDPVE